MTRHDAEFERVLRTIDRLIARQSPAPPPTGERETGMGGARALVDLISRLETRAGINHDDARTVFAIGEGQRTQDGQAVPRIAPRGHSRERNRLNKTDVSYNALVDGQERRVNVEIDTDPASSVRHQAIVNHRDPQAMNVFVEVDSWSGQPTSVVIRDPRTGRARRLQGAEAATYVRQQLPVPITRRGIGGPPQNGASQLQQRSQGGGQSPPGVPPTAAGRGRSRTQAPGRQGRRAQRPVGSAPRATRRPLPATAGGRTPQWPSPRPPARRRISPRRRTRLREAEWERSLEAALHELGG